MYVITHEEYCGYNTTSNDLKQLKNYKWSNILFSDEEVMKYLSNLFNGLELMNDGTYGKACCSLIGNIKVNCCEYNEAVTKDFIKSHFDTMKEEKLSLFNKLKKELGL